MGKKINLGSADKKIEGFTNVDIRPGKNVDIAWDITEIPWNWANDNSIEVIIAEEVFEHIGWKEIFKVFKEIHRVLEPNGWLHLTVPDIGKMCEYYINGEICDCISHKEPEGGFKADPNCEKCHGKAKCNPERFRQALAGAQKHPWDIHRNHFFKRDMIKQLEKLNFKVRDISPNNWYKIKLRATK